MGVATARVGFASSPAWTARVVKPCSRSLIDLSQYSEWTGTPMDADDHRRKRYVMLAVICVPDTLSSLAAEQDVGKLQQVAHLVVGLEHVGGALDAGAIDPAGMHAGVAGAEHVHDWAVADVEHIVDML